MKVGDIIHAKDSIRNDYVFIVEVIKKYNEVKTIDCPTDQFLRTNCWSFNYLKDKKILTGGAKRLVERKYFMDLFKYGIR